MRFKITLLTLIAFALAPNSAHAAQPAYAPTVIPSQECVLQMTITQPSTLGVPVASPILVMMDPAIPNQYPHIAPHEQPVTISGAQAIAPWMNGMKAEVQVRCVHGIKTAALVATINGQPLQFTQGAKPNFTGSAITTNSLSLSGEVLWPPITINNPSQQIVLLATATDLNGNPVTTPPVQFINAPPMLQLTLSLPTALSNPPVLSPPFPSTFIAANPAFIPSSNPFLTSSQPSTQTLTVTVTEANNPGNLTIHFKSSNPALANIQSSTNIWVPTQTSTTNGPSKPVTQTTTVQFTVLPDATGPITLSAHVDSSLTASPDSTVTFNTLTTNCAPPTVPTPLHVYTDPVIAPPIAGAAKSATVTLSGSNFGDLATVHMTGLPGGYSVADIAKFTTATTNTLVFPVNEVPVPASFAVAIAPPANITVPNSRLQAVIVSVPSANTPPPVPTAVQSLEFTVYNHCSLIPWPNDSYFMSGTIPNDN